MQSPIFFHIAVIALFLFGSDPLFAQTPEPPLAARRPAVTGQSPEFFTARPSISVPMLYLAVPEVQLELRVIREQLAELERLQEKFKSTGIPVESGKNFLNKTLKPEQRKRLQQIILRHREREHGIAPVLASLIPDLQLTPKQLDQIDRLRAARAESILEYATSGDRFRKIRLDVFETTQEHAKRFREVLSKEQQAKLDDLLGEPFKPRIAIAQSEPLPQRQSIYFTHFFGKDLFALHYLQAPVVQNELKLTPEQKGQVGEQWLVWNKNFEEMAAVNPNLVLTIQITDARVWPDVAKALKPEQLTRLTEVTHAASSPAGRSTARCAGIRVLPIS